MANTQLNRNQIQDGIIDDSKVAASAGIATSKLAEGADFINRTGTVPFQADQSMNGYRLIDVAEPIIGTDAANKDYVDNAISSFSPVNFVDEETPSGDVDGTNVTFTLAFTPVAGSVKLFLNGQRLKTGASDDYTISGDTIIMAVAPGTGETLLADYRK